MRSNEILALARRLGRLKDAPNIDEATRVFCVDAVEETIMAISSTFDRSNILQQFRREAKVKE